MWRIPPHLKILSSRKRRFTNSLICGPKGPDCGQGGAGPGDLSTLISDPQTYRRRTDERNSREKHRLWISRAYRETQTLNPEKISENLRNQAKYRRRTRETQRPLKIRRVFLSLEVASICGESTRRFKISENGKSLLRLIGTNLGCINTSRRGGTWCGEAVPSL